MYAVLTTGGKQYRVEAGSTLVVEKLAGEPGSSVTFDRVLLVGDGESVMVGTPTVAGASVVATVLGEELGEKIIVFKFKQKVKYRRRTGHRQHLTRLRIDSISADGRTVTAEAAAPAPRARRAAETAETAEKAEKPKARTRSRSAAAKAAPAEKAEPADEAPAERKAATEKTATEKKATEKKPRARARTASASKKAEPAEKPKARRTSRTKAETAKEE